MDMNMDIEMRELYVSAICVTISNPPYGFCWQIGLVFIIVHDNKFQL